MFLVEIIENIKFKKLYQQEVKAHKKTKAELESWRVNCKVLVDELFQQDRRIQYLINKSAKKYDINSMS